MPFKKGDPKPAGSGKKKGSKNKKTLQWEALGKFITEKGAEKLMKVLEAQDDKEFIKSYGAILEYFKPKLARTELTGKDGDDLIINTVNYGENTSKAEA
jgi:hypothetical protein